MLCLYFLIPDPLLVRYSSLLSAYPMGTLIRMSDIVLFNQQRIQAFALPQWVPLLSRLPWLTSSSTIKLFSPVFATFICLYFLGPDPLLVRCSSSSLSAYRMGTPIRMSAIVLFNQQRIRDRQKRDQLAEAFRRADKVGISHKKKLIAPLQIHCKPLQGQQTRKCCDKRGK